MAEVVLPNNNWRPRHYQKPLWDALERGRKRCLAVCHRRWGKDDVALHWSAVSAHEKPAVYWHMLPEYAQARKVIWTAVNASTALRRIDEAFPPLLRANCNEQEMFIRFKIGAVWQVVGSDNYNSLMGAPPYGIVFSEYALANPASFAFLSPILEENHGWALFIYTARGRNHGYDLYNYARSKPDEWHVEFQTADDTGIFTKDQLTRIHEDYCGIYGEDEGRALFLQEYYCDFNAPLIGAYYGRLLAELDKKGAIRSVPHDPSIPVYTAWDLGLDDATAIWFWQLVGTEVRFIDYYEVNNKSLTDIAGHLKNDYGYTYETHFGPHDLGQREMTTAKSRAETLISLKFGRIAIGAQLPVEDGINAARILLPRCVFDRVKCKRGLDALGQYRREWNDKLKTYVQKPLHDWTSHAADAFREAALNISDIALEMKRRKPAYSGDYDPFNPYGGHRRQETAGEWSPF